jgi:AcrR family transcriptional regulator
MFWEHGYEGGDVERIARAVHVTKPALYRAFGENFRGGRSPLLSRGFRATGTEKIMYLAEVAKATFYRHFESKNELVLACLERRDRAFWEYLDSPAPPEDIHKALVKIERMVNLPEITSCPFLRVVPEYPDTVHPFHRRVIKHEDKLHDYLAELLKPYPVDKNARRRAYLASLMALSPCEWSMELRRRFRFSRPPREYSRAFRARELNAANDWLSLGCLIPSQRLNPEHGSMEPTKFKALRGRILYEIYSELACGR